MMARGGHDSTDELYRTPSPLPIDWQRKKGRGRRNKGVQGKLSELVQDMLEN